MDGLFSDKDIEAAMNLEKIYAWKKDNDKCARCGKKDVRYVDSTKFEFTCANCAERYPGKRIGEESLTPYEMARLETKYGKKKKASTPLGSSGFNSFKFDSAKSNAKKSDRKKKRAPSTSSSSSSSSSSSEEEIIVSKSKNKEKSKSNSSSKQDSLFTLPGMQSYINQPQHQDLYSVSQSAQQIPSMNSMISGGANMNLTSSRALNQPESMQMTASDLYAAQQQQMLQQQMLLRQQQQQQQLQQQQQQQQAAAQMMHNQMMAQQFQQQMPKYYGQPQVNIDSSLNQANNPFSIPVYNSISDPGSHTPRSGNAAYQQFYSQGFSPNFSNHNNAIQNPFKRSVTPSFAASPREQYANTVSDFSNIPPYAMQQMSTIGSLSNVQHVNANVRPNRPYTTIGAALVHHKISENNSEWWL